MANEYDNSKKLMIDATHISKEGKFVTLSNPEELPGSAYFNSHRWMKEIFWDGKGPYSVSKSILSIHIAQTDNELDLIKHEYVVDGYTIEVVENVSFLLVNVEIKPKPGKHIDLQTINNIVNEICHFDKNQNFIELPHGVNFFTNNAKADLTAVHQGGWETRIDGEFKKESFEFLIIKRSKILPMREFTEKWFDDKWKSKFEDKK